MKEDISNSQTACNRAQKEKKEMFAFCVGIDLGDKHSNVCVLDSEEKLANAFV